MKTSDLNTLAIKQQRECIENEIRKRKRRNKGLIRGEEKRRFNEVLH